MAGLGWAGLGFGEFGGGDGMGVRVEGWGYGGDGKEVGVWRGWDGMGVERCGEVEVRVCVKEVRVRVWDGMDV